MRFMFERKSYMNRIFLKLFVSLIRILDEKGNVSMIQSQMEHFFREYYGVCYRAAFTLVKNHADAEDVAQEVLIRLLIYRPELANKEAQQPCTPLPPYVQTASDPVPSPSFFSIFSDSLYCSR